MTSTQNRRKEYNYREEYMKHNQGIFGLFYICAQCGKPILPENMEVDHIIPLSKMGLNHHLNCVATCKHCNRKKSDKIGIVSLRGFLWKILEETCIGINFILSILLKLFSVVLQPLTNKINISGKLILIVILYIYILYFFLSNIRI